MGITVSSVSSVQVAVYDYNPYNIISTFREYMVISPTAERIKAGPGIEAVTTAILVPEPFRVFTNGIEATYFKTKPFGTLYYLYLNTEYVLRTEDGAIERNANLQGDARVVYKIPLEVPTKIKP